MLEDLLTSWGTWERGGGGLGWPTCTAEYSALFYGGRYGKAVQREIEREAAESMGVRVSALPEPLQRVLVAEYVKGGTVRDRLTRAGMSRSSYYRALGQARAALVSL